MSEETNMLHHAKDFEKRIIDIFQVLGYDVEQPREPSDFDFLISKRDFPFEIKALVEVKYFERSLVPASIVYKYLDMIQRYNVDKAIIVTTLGFTKEANSFAQKSDGKIVLLTEAELIERIPGRRAREYCDSLLRAHYVLSSIREYFETAKPSFENMLQRVPKDRLCELLYEFASFKDLVNFIAEKIPKNKILEQFERILEPSEVKEILMSRVKRIEIPAYKKRDIESIYNQAKISTDPVQKGRLLEKAIKEIFELVPGLKVVGSNVNDGIEEIDLQIRNYNREHVWADFEGMIFVECKNWSKPVGSDEIDHFVGKLERNGLNSGILIAVKGVTGRHVRLEGAWGAIKMYLQKGRKIIVLDDKDIEDILKCTDISDKVDEKYIHLYKLGSA